MGDMSELRGLVFIGTFLSVTVLLIGWLPVSLYDSPSYRSVTPPDEVWEGVDLMSFANYTELQFNETGGADWVLDSTFYRVDVTMGGHDVDVIYKKNGTGAYSLRLYHAYNIYWDLWGTGHDMKWYDSRGIERDTDYAGEYYWLGVSTIQENIRGDNQTSTFQAKCPYDHSLTYHTTFRFNSTTYTDFQDAWDSEAVYMLCAINFDDVGTGYTTWDTLANVLFFQIPNTNPYLNALISVPIFVGAVYIAVILLYRTIGVIFGGGA